MSNKRAFTIIEVLVGIMLFAIMSIAVAGLFRLYGDLIKKPAEQSVNLPRYQAAVFHLIKNIRNSTWITIPDSNNIELHSHSNPDIRKYKFEGNKLKFKEGSANYRVLIENIGATEFFKGEGNEKPGNRFQKVKIEFWEKAIGNHTESDIFYNSLELASEESWDAIYIDPLNASTYKDGTKVFPFSILDDTLSNILQDEVIYVLSGEYDFYDETTLPCKGLDFFPGTILTVNPASHVKMGFDTVLLSEGEFYCSGTETEKITIEPITTEGIRIAPMNTGTGRILVHSLEESLEFKYLILKYTDFHVIPPADNISINLNMANNNLTTSMLSVVSYGGNVDLQNNYMKGGYRPIWVYAIQDTGSSTTLNIRNNEVDHIYYEDRPVEYYGSSPYRNSSDGGYGIFVDMLGLGPAYQTIENNIVRNTWFAGIMYRGYKSNTEGYMRIKNNFVDSGDGARGIAIVSTTTPPRGMKHQMIIANNEVKNVTAKWWTSFYFDGGIAVQYTPSDDIEIKNNEIYDCRYGIKLTGTDAVIKNNVLYNNDTADIAKNLRTKSGMTIENNTIYDNKAGGNSIYGDDGSIKNCIVWGTGAKIGGKLNKKVTYSDAKGITKGKGNIIPAEDPMFESPASADFRLKVGSPCINKGDPKSQYNDPDRTRNDMGAYGGPGAADGVGPQPPPGG